MHVDLTICSPCWRDANTASILTPCCIIGQQTIERNWNVVSNETNTDVRMYIEEFILVDVVTLLYKLEVKWICIGRMLVYIHSQQRNEKGWDYSQMYNWHNVVNRITISENLSTMRTNVWIAIPLFGALMPLGGVNGNLYWHFYSSNSWGNYWMSFL